MKKLFTLVAILPAVSLSVPCFGVDFIRDRIYTSSSYSSGDFSYSVGYHYTNSVKILVEPIISVASIFKGKLQGGILANLRYHYEFTNTDIALYVNVGIGAAIDFVGQSKFGFSYKISSGLDFPLSSRTSVFAGYRLLKAFEDYNHGFELGINYNL
ncbi:MULTISPECIES: P44/Msp2 family outer membrane protein [unclassified Wolbachia]|uniref:P44/Msp2 family outer membrane protein n=1 Tax=unclassified Wolbachia TaxID=2640676 RepID=UPI00222E8DFE|nr:P44/Msp2 family outer membrane protein [Wolbachia endosymbiont (group A) of Apoderus coryli]